MSDPIDMNPSATSGEHASDFRQPSYFSPSDYFLGIAEKAAKGSASSHITLPGRGEALIVPDEDEYFTDVVDMGEFCRAPAAEFKVVHAKTDDYRRLSSSGKRGHIPELLWEAALHASQGRLVGSRSNQEPVHIYDVIRFDHWPNLTRVSKTLNTMRICALLTRQPSSIMLVSRKLGIDHAEMYQVYSAACSYGIVNVISNHMGKADGKASIDDDEDHMDGTRQQGLFRALFNKIAGL